MQAVSVAFLCAVGGERGGGGLTKVSELSTEKLADKGTDYDLEEQFELVYLLFPFALQGELVVGSKFAFTGGGGVGVPLLGIVERALRVCLLSMRKVRHQRRRRQFVVEVTHCLGVPRLGW